MMTVSVDLGDVMVTLNLESHLRLIGLVSFHLKMNLVSIMAAGKQ